MKRNIVFTAIFTIFIFTLALYTSCQSDECEFVTCQNGGTCSGGTCACPTGYSGSRCQYKDDPCAAMDCKNGASCVNGKCYCVGEYTGTYCDKKLCEVNNTAKVRFQNKTGTSLTYEVVWDGSTLTTLAPGSTSEYYTVAAGSHTLHFKIANSGGQEACTQSAPVLAQCSSMEYWCTK